MDKCSVKNVRKEEDRSYTNKKEWERYITNFVIPLWKATSKNILRENDNDKP